MYLPYIASVRLGKMTIINFKFLLSLKYFVMPFKLCNRKLLNGKVGCPILILSSLAKKNLMNNINIIYV